MGAEDFVKLSVRYRVDFAMSGTSAAAELMFVRAMAECGLRNTHGVVTAADLPSLAAGLRGKPTALAAELVAGGFWQVVPQGWAFASWDKWQSELEAVQDKRERDAKRKRDERAAKRAQAGGATVLRAVEGAS